MALKHVDICGHVCNIDTDPLSLMVKEAAATLVSLTVRKILW